ncbi:MAG: T9SS type A sorting domain-containing protein [Chitinophagales bacterium]|nr:T9SS type A sorting domain-containing protein [Chitinophagales bacterium]MDW8272615.1 T9SS type A sorting domain-containing protein [Chitinophagales bacterium]
MKKYLSLIFVLPFVSVYAQSTFTQIYQILNTRCTNSACHSAASGHNLRFDGSENDVFNAIFNKPPENTVAKNKLDRLVFVNQPYESFLLRKINKNLDTDLDLEQGEGNVMLDINGQPLANHEVELIRQWIINGAKKTGITVDTAVINEYYRDPYHAFLQKPVKPAPGEGKRIRCGPIFLPKSGPGKEFEILLKYELNFPYEAEIYKIDGFMNYESHHFLLFRFNDSASAAQEPDGIRVVSLTGGTTSFDGNKQLTGAWQDDEEIDLPKGTALFWPKKVWLDLNYHIKNYGNQHVLPCDFYCNIYYTPRQPKTIEMKSRLVNSITLGELGSGGNQGFLPPNSGPVTRYLNDPDNGRNEVRYLWMFNSHTHQYGIDFDLFEYDKSKPNRLGKQLYEGFWNYKLNYDMGQYLWDHPPIRYWPNFYPVDMKIGLRARAMYNNTSNKVVRFGFTTEDEMFLYYYMYTTRLPDGWVSAPDIATKINSFGIYPNPASDKAFVIVESKEPIDIKVMICDIHGKVIAELFSGQTQIGVNQYSIPDNLPQGVYLAQLFFNGQIENKKFVISR